MSKSFHDITRQQTAIHEAGHAVMACLCGVAFVAVTIEETAESFGRMVFDSNPVESRDRPFRDRQLGEWSTSADPQSMLLVLAAGLAAEYDVCGHLELAQVSLALPDVFQMFSLLTTLPEADRSAAINDAFGSAYQRIQAHRPALDAVAVQLLEHERMTHAEVSALVREASCP